MTSSRQLLVPIDSNDVSIDDSFGGACGPTRRPRL